MPLYSLHERCFACGRAGFIPLLARLGEYIHYASLCIEKTPSEASNGAFDRGLFVLMISK